MRRLPEATHTAVLEGLGRRGEHPDSWATVSPEVVRDGAGLRLILRGERDVLAFVRVPLL